MIVKLHGHRVLKRSGRARFHLTNESEGFSQLWVVSPNSIHMLRCDTTALVYHDGNLPTHAKRVPTRPSSNELNSLQSELELELYPRTNTRHWQLVASPALALLLLMVGMLTRCRQHRQNVATLADATIDGTHSRWDKRKLHATWQQR
jgi:hypothetical protein